MSAQKDGYREMSGKDIMSSYNHIINAALLSRDFEAARASLVSCDGVHVLVFVHVSCRSSYLSCS